MKNLLEPFSSRQFAVLGTLLLVAAADLRAETFYEDHFKAKEQAPGAPLDKVKTETGGAAWECTPNVSLGDGFATVVNKDAFAGRLALPQGATTVSVTARIDPESASGDGGWLAVGIGNPALGNPPWGAGIFVLVRPSGEYALMGDSDPNDAASKSAVRLRGGNVPDYVKGASFSVKLEYGVADKTLSLWLNEAQILDSFSVADKNFTVVPAYAGFSGFLQRPKSTMVESFKVAIKP